MSSHPLQPELPAATPKSTARTQQGAAGRDRRSGGGGGGLGRGAVLALLVALLAAAGGALYSQPGGRDQLLAGLQTSNQALKQAVANLAWPFKLMMRLWVGVPGDFLARMDVPEETLNRLGMSTTKAPADGPPRKQQQREPRAGEVPADSVPRKQQQRELRTVDEAAEEAADGTPRRQQRREARSTLPGDVEPIPQPVPQLPPLPPITQEEIEVFEQVLCGVGVGWWAGHSVADWLLMDCSFWMANLT